MMMEGSKKRKLEEDSNEEKLKRIGLRCEVANIKVIVGGEKQDTASEKEVFWHYSQILASHSRFVDALLTSPLAASTTKKDDDDINDDDVCNNIKEISFPDISPSHWERMIFFITDPVAIRHMTIDDAMELVSMYDKYDFHTGIKLCDEVLSSIFDKIEYDVKDNIELLDRCVHVVILSHEKNLKKSLVNGMVWLRQLFWFGYTSNCVILTVDHIRKLVPVIACYSNDENYDNVQEAIETRLSDESIDILNPMFPAYFISQIQLIVARNTTLKLVNEIKISSCARVAGIYDAFTHTNDAICNTCIYSKQVDDDDDPMIYLKKNETGDWIIETTEDQTLLFICTGSRCEALPPKTGWKKIDDANTLYRTQLPVFTYYSNTTGSRREVKI